MASNKLKEQSEHTTKIQAVHPKLGKRTFSLYEWNMMPADHYGWSKAADKPAAVANKEKEKTVKNLQKEKDSAEKEAEKAQKAYDDAAAKYLEATQSTDEKVKATEAQLLMKKDDAERALSAAQTKLQSANEALNEAEKD